MERLARLIILLPGVLTPLPAWAQERPWDGWGMHPVWGAWSVWEIGKEEFEARRRDLEAA